MYLCDIGVLCILVYFMTMCLDEFMDEGVQRTSISRLTAEFQCSKHEHCHVPRACILDIICMRHERDNHYAGKNTLPITSAIRAIVRLVIVNHSWLFFTSFSLRYILSTNCRVFLLYVIPRTSARMVAELIY